MLKLYRQPIQLASSSVPTLLRNAAHNLAISTSRSIDHANRSRRACSARHISTTSNLHSHQKQSHSITASSLLNPTRTGSLPYQQQRRNLLIFDLLKKGFQDPKEQEKRAKEREEKALLRKEKTTDLIDRGLIMTDINEMHKKKTKLWKGATEVIPASEAKFFPNVKATNLLGEKIEILEKIKQKKSTLVTLSFKEAAEDMLESWRAPFLAEFQRNPNVQYIELSITEGFAYRILKGFIRRSLRKSIEAKFNRTTAPAAATTTTTKTTTPTTETTTTTPGAEEQGASTEPSSYETQTATTTTATATTAPTSSSSSSQAQEMLSNTLLFFGDSFMTRRQLGIVNRQCAYAFLVDRKGRVRWKGVGIATPEETSNLHLFTYALSQTKKPTGGSSSSSSSFDYTFSSQLED